MAARRLILILGLVAVGAGMAVVGAAVPAMASIDFADCVNVDFTSVGTCGSTALDSTLHWTQRSAGDIGPTGETATTTGRGLGLGFLPLFVTQEPDSTGQGGLGIAFPSGGTDNEVNQNNFVTIQPDNPSAKSATITIDSLQAGESSIICANPISAIPGNGTCTTLTGPVMSQTVTVPLTPGGVVNVGGGTGFGFGTGDVKIEDFDVSVPEPSTLALLVTGVAGLVLVRRRRNSI